MDMLHYCLDDAGNHENFPLRHKEHKALELNTDIP